MALYGYGPRGDHGIEGAMDQSIAILVIAFCILSSINPIFRLFAELRFYWGNKWDWWQDSGNETWMQDSLRQTRQHWPIGQVKLLGASIRVGISLSIALIFLFFLMR